jgi:hypothetical protein
MLSIEALQRGEAKEKTCGREREREIARIPREETELVKSTGSEIQEHRSSAMMMTRMDGSARSLGCRVIGSFG